MEDEKEKMLLVLTLPTELTDNTNDKAKYKRKNNFKYCSVPTCNVRSDDLGLDGKKVSLHEYPAKHDQRLRWQALLNPPGTREEDYPLVQQKTLVCSRHFQNKCFKECANGLRRLIPGSVPTIAVPGLKQKRKRRFKGDVEAKPKKISKNIATSTTSTEDLILEDGQSCPRISEETNVTKTTKKRKPGLRKVIADKDSAAVISNPLADKAALKKKHCIMIMHSADTQQDEDNQGLKKVNVGVGCRLLDPYDNFKLKKHKNKLRMRVARLKSRLGKLREEYSVAQLNWETWKTTIEDLNIIYQDADRNVPSACYIRDLIFNYTKKRPSWSDTTLRHSIIWRMSGPIGYERASTSKILKIPSKSTLNKHLLPKDINVVNKAAANLLKSKIAKLPDKFKEVTLTIENMDISERCININQDDGSYIANILICTTLRGFNIDLSTPLSYKFVHNVDVDQQHKNICEAVSTVEDIGYKVVKVIVDNDVFDIERNSIVDEQSISPVLQHDTCADNSAMNLGSQDASDPIIINVSKKPQDVPENVITTDESVVIVSTDVNYGDKKTVVNVITSKQKPTRQKPWNLKNVLKSLQIHVKQLDGMEMEFDVIGVDAAIANAFRRILLSEVPSMAFDKVNMYNNSSVMQDEVLAHRLGLIPLKADARQFEYRPEGANPSEQDTLVFELHVRCVKDAKEDEAKDKENAFLIKDQVYSKHLVWTPIGSQQQMFTSDQVGPVADKILIDRMRAGQEIELTLEAVKGIGRQHAKFSPVATASYRLLPTIHLLDEIEGEAAFRLQKCFSPGVIDVIDNGEGRQVAVVTNARYDTCSRNVLQHNDLKNSVIMGRVEDHFIFSVESIGALTPDILFIEAVKVLKKKCTTILDEIQNIF